MENEKIYPPKHKATLYRKTEFFGNVVSDECYVLRTYFQDYAQYKNILHIEMMSKGKRSGYVFRASGSKPFLMLVDGWNNPKPESEMIKIDGGNPAIKCERSKYSCFDSRYVSDFLNQIKDLPKEKIIVKAE